MLNVPLTNIQGVKALACEGMNIFDLLHYDKLFITKGAVAKIEEVTWIMQLHDVLIRPVITEKSTMLMEEGKYTFRVPLTANKVQIRQAVEKIFNVKVKK